MTASLQALIRAIDALKHHEPGPGLRSVGTFGPGWRWSGIEIVGFSALSGRFWRQNLWAHELAEFDRPDAPDTL